MKSRTFFSLALVLSSFSLSAHADLRTVPYVDVARYLGDWFQIAHIPLSFEGIADCTCARQRLRTTDRAGVVSVLNTCTQTDGTPFSISGTATVDDPLTNAQLTVMLEGVPFQGSYWVIGLDVDYRYAVVSDRSGQSLYVLSKTPTLAKELYDEAVALASTQLDTSKLILTRQEGCHYPE